MAADPDRHTAIVQALANSPVQALMSWSPTSVLLLTGYWPVTGLSVAVFPVSGFVCVIVPED